MEPVINDEKDMDTDQEQEQTDQEPTDREDSVPTLSQLHSSLIHPPNDLMHVFYGYSFKGWNSVLLNDKDVSEEEGEGAEDQDITSHSILSKVNDTAIMEVVAPKNDEPKTPEVQPAPLLPSTPPAKQSPLVLKPELPPVNTTMKPTSVADSPLHISEDLPSHFSKLCISPVKAVTEAAAASTGPGIHYKDLKKAPAPKSHGQWPQRNRCEKSRISELDGNLPDTDDGDDVRMVHNALEDNWDFIEADGKDSYGVQGPSLFAHSVVD